MNPFVWLGVAAVFVAIVALTGSAPRGGEPIARTRLMGMARLVFMVGVVVCGAIGVFGAIHR